MLHRKSFSRFIALIKLNIIVGRSQINGKGVKTIFHIYDQICSLSIVVYLRTIFYQILDLFQFFSRNDLRFVILCFTLFSPIFIHKILNTRKNHFYVPVPLLVTISNSFAYSGLSKNPVSCHRFDQTELKQF